ncbi:hypothetical protein QW060_27325 [Myroides ceti]|uniref:Uncharacterized protein n=1 Tax=Paenimyroides ceti TaxID=395087 RepID=A0ABT8D130_9FLAO|nr:hypothetical protein [Paenimyroides ceti]MDN3710510.1 hypothetical protein [Paenimyroides ceti]
MNVFSQKLKTEQGSINNLKGIKSYNLVFDYSNLKVDKFETEEAFLKDKMAKREKTERMKNLNNPGLRIVTIDMNLNLLNRLTSVLTMALLRQIKIYPLPLMKC